jgi:hypothetical protein
MDSKFIKVASMAILAAYVDAKGQRIEGDDIVTLISDQDFLDDALESVGHPLMGA